MKTVAILQSNYIPWKGYFDFINSVDEFVIYDVVQYTKNDWRNRNKIIVNGKPAWITIPVYQKSLEQRIDETEVSSLKWSIKHWRTIEQNYSRLEGFSLYGESLKETYQDLASEVMLSTINIKLIKTICKLMGIETKITSSSNFDLPNDRVERIIHICKELDADCYVSGAAAKAYLDPRMLKRQDIECKWFDYSGYLPYAQKGVEFQHAVSILDLLFNEGRNFSKFMNSFN